MVNRYAVVDENSIVTNVALWDGESEWNHGANVYKLSKDSPVSIGWTYSDGVFTPPENPAVEERPSVVTIDISALTDIQASVENATNLKDLRDAFSKLISAIQT